MTVLPARTPRSGGYPSSRPASEVAGVLGMAVVEGVSMQPTLHPGDRLLVRYGGRPRAGALALVRLPERPLSVKRLGHRTDEGWWVERDNPREGTDSWTAGVGAVADRDVVATVLVRVWPRPGPLPRRSPDAS